MLSHTQNPARRDALDVATTSEGARVASAPMGSSRRRRRHGRWHGVMVFALNFLRHPLAVGTLFQSSRALVRRLADRTPLEAARTVVELGPGVGTVTTALLQRMPVDSTLLAIESNTDFVAELRDTVDDARLTVVAGDAVALAAHLRDHGHDNGMDTVDIVVSGIPFSTMPRSARAAVLDAVAAVLADDGELVIYQHSALVAPLLEARFGDVRRETEWRSLVPMRVFRCRRPHRIAAGG